MPLPPQSARTIKPQASHGIMGSFSDAFHGSFYEKYIFGCFSWIILRKIWPRQIPSVAKRNSEGRAEGRQNKKTRPNPCYAVAKYDHSRAHGIGHHKREGNPISAIPYHFAQHCDLFLGKYEGFFPRHKNHP
jgi:hypothetical protein